MYRKKVKTYTAVTVTLRDSAAEVVGYGSIAGATGLTVGPTQPGSFVSRLPDTAIAL